MAVRRFALQPGKTAKAIIDPCAALSIWHALPQTRHLAVLGLSRCDAGVDVGSSIDLTADVLRMTPIRQAVRSTREKIIEGKELSGVLDRTRQFSPDVIAVVETGEETGKLSETLAHLADDYDEQISTMVANLGQLVQPIMIVCLGAMVLFIILAVLMPIIQMISSLAAPG